MSFKDKLVSSLAGFASRLPRSYAIKGILSSYVDSFAGDNNMNPATNGEDFIITEMIPGCEIVFDVGANDGQWTSRVLSTNQTCHVHAFEPSPMTFALLEKNVRSNRAICRRLALGERAGTLPLLNRQSHPHLSSFYRATGEEIEKMNIETKEVTIDCLDQYCSREKIHEIDFLKIDVEGHETAVLRGAAQLIASRSIKVLQFEYHATWIYSRSFLKDAFDLLSSAGYHTYKLLGGSKLCYLPRYSQDLETFRYSNYVSSRDEISSQRIKVLVAKHMT